MGLAYDNYAFDKVTLLLRRYDFINLLKERVMSEEKKFDDLMERLSDREWQSRDGVVAVEDMSESHINRVIQMIEGGEILLSGLEEEYIEMFREELEDRGDVLDFDN